MSPEFPAFRSCTLGERRSVRVNIETFGVTGLPDLPTDDENDACVAAVLAAAADGAVPGITAKGIGAQLSIELDGTLREGLMVIPDLTALAHAKVLNAIGNFKKFPKPLQPVLTPAPPSPVPLPAPPQHPMLTQAPQKLQMPGTEFYGNWRFRIFVLVILVVLIAFAFSHKDTTPKPAQPVLTPSTVRPDGPPAVPIPRPPIERTAHVRIVNLAESVVAGKDVSLTAHAKPGMACTIAYFTPSGNPSKAHALDPKLTGNDGTVTWTWRIGSSTSPGAARVSVTCGSKRDEKSFVVQTK